MRRMYTRRTWIRWQSALLGLAVLSMTGAFGCSDDDNTVAEPQPNPYLAQVTPENVLRNLITAYVEEDLDEYEKLFDHDLFEFVFDPLDVQEDQDLPPFWLWDEERESAKNMFDSNLVLDIRLEYVPGMAVQVDEGDDVPDLSWMKVEVTNIELEIETKDPLGGENIIYKVSGDRGVFFFREYPNETVGGLPLVRIVEWRDQRTAFRLPSVENSWGNIKSVFS